VTPVTPRRLGAIAILFSLAHAAEILARASAQNLLWSCNVASAVSAVGLALGSATANAAGGLLLVAGVPLWILDLAGGGAFYPTSLLTHVGVTGLSLAGMRRLGAPRLAWPAAVAVLAAATTAAALVSSPAENVNVAVVSPPGWERFPSHGAYMLWLGTTLCAAMLGILFALRWLLRRTSPAAG
jgi:hypothetical protein